MQMWSIGDWFSLITLLLSFPLAVAGTLFAPRLLRFLENRKLIKTNKSKQQALQHYQHIKALREGRRDINAFYLLLVGVSVLSAIAASTILISTFTFAPVSNPLFLLLLLAFVFAFVSVIFLAAMYETSRRIDQFDRYEAELEEQWGPLD